MSTRTNWILMRRTWRRKLWNFSSKKKSLWSTRNKFSLSLSLIIAGRLSTLEICERKVSFYLQSVAILNIDNCHKLCYNYLNSWIMGGDRQCYRFSYYYHFCNIQIKIDFLYLPLRKKRHHRSNIKFYHIPYRIACEEMLLYYFSLSNPYFIKL